MDELKELKSQWASQSFDKQYDKKELNAFLKQKSMHSIRWIFYLSILEFLLYLILPLLLPNYFESYAYYRTLNLYEFAVITTGLGHALLIFFMLRFYRNYRSISIDDTISGHLRTILNTRRTVNQYIYCNLIILLVFIVTVFYKAYQLDENLISLDDQTTSMVVLLLSFGFVIALILGIFGLLYYFVYGRFLRPLKKNEKELKQLNA